MQRWLTFLTIICLLWSVAGCGVSESEFQQVIGEREQLKKDVADAREANRNLKAALDDVNKEVSGLLSKIELCRVEIERANIEEERNQAGTDEAAANRRAEEVAAGTAAPTEPAATETPAQPAATETPAQPAATETPAEPTATETPAQPVAAETPAAAETAAPAETQPEPHGNVLYYYALQNDTLNKIAVRKGVSVDTLVQMNGGMSPDAVLKDGQRIRVK